MSLRDWATYSQLFDNLVKFIRPPDLIIYLKASTDTLLSRIAKRNRDFEKNLDPEYLHSLNIYYDKWILKMDKKYTLILETDNFNIFKDQEKLIQISKQIRNKLDKKRKKLLFLHRAQVLILLIYIKI